MLIGQPIGPGMTYDPHFPLYARVAVPIQVESGVVVFLRLGGGWKFIDLGFFRAYFELTVDLALGGNGVKLGSHSVNALWGSGSGCDRNVQDGARFPAQPRASPGGSDHPGLHGRVPLPLSWTGADCTG